MTGEGCIAAHEVRTSSMRSALSDGGAKTASVRLARAR